MDTVTFDKNTVEVNGTTGGTINATAKSTSNKDITDAVTWSVAPLEKGVTIDADTGVITVGAKAEAETYTVTATPGGTGKDSQGEAKTADFTVTRATPVVQKLIIYKGTAVLNANGADTGADTLIAPADGSADTTYTAKTVDQYDKEEDVTDTASWTLSAAASGITANKNVVTVASTTADDATATMTVTAGGKTVALTLTAKALVITWPKAQDTVTGTYGQTWAQILGANATTGVLTGGSATLAGNKVDGTFTVENPTVKPVVGGGTQKYTLKFDSTDGEYTVTKEFSATINAKSIKDATITVDPITAQTYTGVALTPEPVVKDGGTTLTKDTHYTLGSYTDNVNVGTAKVTITGTGNYTGTRDVTFQIKPAAVTLGAVSDVKIYANDASNTNTTALASKLPAKVTGTIPGGTVEFDAAWTTTDSFDAKGKTYTFTPTLTNGVAKSGDSNFTLPSTLPTAKVIVTPVNVTLSFADGQGAKSVKAAVVKDASDLTPLGLPATVKAAYTPAGAGVTDGTLKIISWTPALSSLQTTATALLAPGSTKTEETVTMTPVLTGDGSQIQNWMTVGTAPGYALTITSRAPVDVTVTVSDKTYDGTPVTAATASQAAIDVNDGTDDSGNASFTFKYTGTAADGTAYDAATPPTKAGTYTVTATLVSNTHSGTGTANFTIAPKAISDGSITVDPASIPAQTYTGAAITPTFKLTDSAIGSGTELGSGTDYTVSYADNTNKGQATITVTGKGNYSGTKAINFTIDQLTLTADMITVSPASMTYTGSALTPTVSVKNGAINLPTADYDVAFSKNTDVGEASVTVTGKGNCTGTPTKTFTITPAELTGSVSITSSAGNGKIAAGTVLTADVSGLTPAGATVTYEWQNNGTAIPGAASSTYTVRDGDGEITLKVTGTGNYTGTKEATVTAGKKPAPTGDILDFKLAAAKDPDTNQTVLTATISFSTTEWSSLSEFLTHFIVVWLRNGTVIVPNAAVTGSATTRMALGRAALDGKGFSEYVIQPEDKGATITCELRPNPESPSQEYSENLKISATAASSGTIEDSGTLNGGTGGFTVGEKTVPGAPTGVAVSTDADKKTITVTWTAPANDGDAPITGYTVVLKDANGNVVSTTDAAADARTCTISLPSYGTNYTVEVTAKNSVGNSDPAASASFKVDEPETSGGGRTPNRGSSSGPAYGNRVTVATPETDTSATTANASGFTDVPDSHTFATEIKWARDNGYMNGTGSGAFSPSGIVNRQQLWMVLARIAGENPANMAEARQWALSSAISDGTNPTGALSRQQLVTMMYRFAAMLGKATEGGADLSTYPDAGNVSGYAQDALAWAVANGIVNGTSTGALNPWGGATRGAFAAILYRYMQA